MSGSLRDLPVLVIDCQASGATPAHGDVLELGWGVCDAQAMVGEVRGQWLVPRTERPVPRAVRELTGWSQACLASAAPEQEVWAELASHARRLHEQSGLFPVPTVIHFARFELPFLRDLHARLGSGDFPLDVRCVHAVAARMFPELPRRSIRALAGYLGHPAELVRRAAGHVEATAFIWRALLPQLEAQGVQTWDQLGAWLKAPLPTPRPKKRTFPLALEIRRSLPDAPGVYRFVRKSGDVLYVGKATSLKKRIAGHFAGSRHKSERELELLTQVHDVGFTETKSTLEAALLECDEIKSIDPPYNVQLRAHERHAWFAARDFADAAPAPDSRHRTGPLPSRRAVTALWALKALAAGAEPTPSLMAVALAVPVAFLPDVALFKATFEELARELLHDAERLPERRVQRAALSLWLTRRRAEPEASEEPPPDTWDAARVRRRLERSLVQASLLVRRARFLCLLADAHVAFQEPESTAARMLCMDSAEVTARADLSSVAALAEIDSRRMASRIVRQTCFDAARYDRMRVLMTELARIHVDGGEVAVRFGQRTLCGERLSCILQTI